MILGIIAVIIGAVLFKGYRDLEEVKRIAAEFKPELIKVAAETQLTEIQKKIEETCLKGESQTFQNGDNRDWICKCLALNWDHYISPLLPKGGEGRVADVKMFLSHSEEIGAKGAVLMRLCSEASVNVQKNVTIPKLEIDPADRACTKDSDCQHITIQCSCSCGQGINKLNAAKYEGQLDDLCRHYDGIMCKVICHGSVKCKDKLCTYIQSEG